MFFITKVKQTLSHLPTTISVKSKPRLTLFLYTWLGRFAKPTYPSSSFVAFPYFLSRSFSLSAAVAGSAIALAGGSRAGRSRLRGSVRSGRSPVNRVLGSNFGAGAGNSAFLKNASRLAALNWKHIKIQHIYFNSTFKSNSDSTIWKHKLTAFTMMF